MFLSTLNQSVPMVCPTEITEMTFVNIQGRTYVLIDRWCV